MIENESVSWQLQKTVKCHLFLVFNLTMVIEIDLFIFKAINFLFHQRKQTKFI